MTHTASLKGVGRNRIQEPNTIHLESQTAELVALNNWNLIQAWLVRALAPNLATPEAVMLQNVIRDVPGPSLLSNLRAYSMYWPSGPYSWVRCSLTHTSLILVHV